MAQDHDNREHALTRRRTLESMIWTGAGLVCLGSCGVSRPFRVLGIAEANPAMAQTLPTIPIIVKDTTSLYWQTVLAGARKAGQDLGVKVPELGAQSETDINGQISILENAAALNPAAIVIAPAQFAGLGKAISSAATKVKMIGIDSLADTNAWSSMLATDNEQAGRVAADILAERIQKTYADAEGDVAIITAAAGDRVLDARAKGFKERIASNYGALDIVAHEVADGQTPTGFRIMTDLIAAHPELRGVFASNPAMARGAAQAIAGNKTNKTGDKINLVGFDFDDMLVKFLQDDTIAALVVQDPFRMGYEGIATGLAVSKGESVPANVDTGTFPITKANLNSARSQELINPKVK